MTKITKTDAEWQAQLSDKEYHVTRKAGTERAFSSPLNDEKRHGTFNCVCCGEPLFASDSKYDSGSGWPSFYQPIDADVIEDHEDRKLFAKRVENRCAKCDAHLGHVFADGPAPTGQRFCMNGASLKFVPTKKSGDE